MWGALWNKVYRRDFIQKNGINCSHGKCVIMEDIFFLSELLTHNPIVAYIDVATYRYKIRNGSLSNQGCTREWWMKAIDASNAIYYNLSGKCAKRLVQYRPARLKYMMLFEKNVTNDMFYSYHRDIMFAPKDIAPISYRVLFFVASCGMRSFVMLLFRIVTRVKHEMLRG